MRRFTSVNDGHSSRNPKPAATKSNQSPTTFTIEEIQTWMRFQYSIGDAKYNCRTEEIIACNLKAARIEKLGVKAFL